MNSKKIKRSRGIVLTHNGWQKIQKAKTDWEFRDNQGYKITLEELGDRAGLTTATLRKILTRDCGVDKRSIATLFSTLNLELESSDYTSPKSTKTIERRLTIKRIDWGEAIDVTSFHGRSLELATLNKWLLEDNCRLITIIGMGGIGKTALSVKLAEQIKDKYDYLIWRSLRDAPPIQEILNNIIQFLCDKQDIENELPENLNQKLSLLIECLRSSRCLIILDNVESILCNSSRAGICEEEYKEYERLFQRTAESTHQSCLLLTSREKPKQVCTLEGEKLPVRSLQLHGFDEKEAEKILKNKGLSGSQREIAKLVSHYSGNALALKIIGTTIRDLFGGKISEFLQQNIAIFGDVRDLLDRQFNRLIDIEKKIMYWLAINREPITLSQIQEDLVDSVSISTLIEGLESLSRRCLIDKTESREIEPNAEFSFTLQSVVMEYVTGKLIESVCGEIVYSKIELFRFHALVKATAKDYIKNTQIRLILQPVINNLLNILKGKKNFENQLKQIITTTQEISPLEPGYTAGNIINLFCHLGTDLKGYDFSNLCIWQADLQNICLHDVNFQYSDLSKTVFCETFGGIISVAFSPDGEILAAGDSNGDIHLWRVADSRPLNTFRGHTSWVTSLNFSPNNMLLASGSSDSNVKLWNIKTGECLKTLEENRGEVWSVVFSPNGEMLASGSDDCTIRIWKTSTTECIKVFQEHTSWVTSIAFCFDGNRLASGSDDRTIRLWDINTGKCLKIFQGHSDGVRSIAFSRDNQILVSGSDDRTIKIWNANTSECLRTLDGHSNRVFSVAFSSKGDIVASGSHDQTVKIWSTNTGKCIYTFQEHSNWVFSVAFNPEGNILASGSRDQTVKLLNLNKNKYIKTFQGYSNQILSVCFSPDRKKLASGSQDRTIRLWDINTGECIKILQGHSNWVYSIAFSPQGDRLISGSEDKTIKLWDINTKQCLKTFEGHNSSVRSVAFSPNGKIFASSGEDNLLKLWDTNSGQVLKTLTEHNGAIWSIAFSPDGKTLASGSFDRTIKLWDVNTGRCLKTLAEHETWVWSIAFSPDGKTLASSSPDETIKLWNIKTGECKKNLRLPTGWLLSIAFSKDGHKLAASSQDCTIKLWDVNSHKLINTFLGHKNGYIWSVAFCSDSKIIASGSEDETIRLWNIETGNCYKILKIEGLYKGLNLERSTGLSESTILGLKKLGIVDLT
ncbi:NB-ARC domain-containing protein [Myxosarcina sp. GI1]|uniref:WD40 domain-containing protein n=1 Tax=Myxosarcina sp. GI1 TaxID=1541065 RepID=UPI00055F3B41|nr:NB-ARC domain-containing protein [Myxosarcina sp. GI1]